MVKVSVVVSSDPDERHTVSGFRSIAKAAPDEPDEAEIVAPSFPRDFDLSKNLIPPVMLIENPDKFQGADWRLSSLSKSSRPHVL